MRKWIFLISTVVLISACETKEDQPLDGIWITAYTQLSETKKFPSYSRNLLEFQDTSVLVTAIGDMSSFKFGDIEQRNMSYEMMDSSFNLAGDQYIIKFGGDSMYLSPVGSKNTLIVFKRLSESLKNPSFSAKDFEDSFSWETENQVLDFVSDSVVIPQKLMNGINLPAEKWSVLEYKGFQFFNIHNELFGLTLIKSSNSEEIHLLKNNIRFEDIHLKKNSINSKSDRKNFMGSWRSTNQRENQPPLFVDIEKDKISIKKDSLQESLIWDLNSGGDKLFFPEIANDPKGVWKLIELTDESLKLEMFGWGSVPNNISIVEFEKIRKPKTEE